MGWGCKHFPRAPDTMCPPGTSALTPSIYNAVFTDIGAFLRRNRVHHTSHSLVTVQTQLKSMSKLSSLHPAVLPPHVIKGYRLRYCTAALSSPRAMGTPRLSHLEELRRSQQLPNTRTSTYFSNTNLTYSRQRLTDGHLPG